MRRPQATLPAEPPPLSWTPYVLITAAALALYGRVCSFGFVYLDDNALILDNFRFLNAWSSLAAVFRQDVFRVSHSISAYYRPLFMASLVFDAHWAGLWPGGYHLTNLALHAAASLLVFRFFLKMSVPRRAALFWALFFAVSPVLTQSIGLVPTRDDTILGVFVLLAFGRFVDFSRSGEAKDALFHALYFTLALFAKETGVMLAPICLLYLWLVARRPVFSRPMGGLFCGWLLSAAVWSHMRRAALQNPLHIPAVEMAKSVAQSWPGFVQFCGKIVLPFHLSVLPFMQDTPMVEGYAALGLVALGLWAAKRARGRQVLFGAAWFLLFLAPSMTLGATTFANIMMEKRAYVPIIGFLLAAVETPISELVEAGGAGVLAGATALLLAYAALAFRHCSHFTGPFPFWLNAVETSPHSPLAHRNLGAMYYLAGRLGPAEAQDKAAIALSPVEPMVHSNLGLIYMNTNRLAEAEGEFRREIAVNPGYENGYFNLGLLYYRLGRTAEAVPLWEKTLTLNPDHVDANADLAIYYQQQKKPEKAAPYLERLRLIDEQAYLRVSRAVGRAP